MNIALSHFSGGRFRLCDLRVRLTDRAIDIERQKEHKGKAREIIYVHLCAYKTKKKTVVKEEERR